MGHWTEDNIDKSFDYKLSDDPESSYSMIQGRTNSYSKIGDLLDSSKNPIFMVTTIEDVLRMYYTPIPEKISQCKERGIPVKLLTDSKSNHFLSLTRRLQATETRTGPLPSSGRIIVEKSSQLAISGELSQSLDLDDSGDTLLYTNSTGMIKTMYDLCKRMWLISRPLDISQ
ncbi:MAG: hypothetical protein DWQ18_08815 [Crenarchaeota archaeon]|nr:MAG: hypothetical protein DWQ17_00970 [Thermoproteota archaeon]RDJ33237.1 MAG: hypothetical protein DWQ18_08815 [Thermoproteota archaeon]RDJ36260.1 MAG: hypothetical protein DWQ19_06505 [Thermoproteota archaeon]RDJ38890.1 MAG: hypothetical protein DWQ13_00970 [Thermoproteota archaeon]